MQTQKIKFTALPVVSGFLLLFLSFCLFSCKKDRISANGKQTTEIRTLSTFTHVHTSGSTPVFITYGNEYKVEIKGSENLVSRYKSTVSGSELSLGYEQLSLGKDDLKVYVTLPLLQKITLSGSAKMEVNGSFPDQSDFFADISGSGNIQLLGAMKSELTKINVSGTGNALFKNLISRTAELNISGNGDIRNSVDYELKGTISGHGNIYFTGNPTLQLAVSGTGKVLKD